MTIRLTKVENGWILQITKIDVLTGRPDPEEVLIYGKLDEALEKIKSI